MAGATPSWGEIGLGMAAVAALTYVAIAALTKKPPERTISLQDAMNVIKQNTEANTKLVSTLENQTRVIGDLAMAVNRLLGRLDGLP